MSKQGVDPGEPDVEAAKAEGGPEDPEYSVRDHDVSLMDGGPALTPRMYEDSADRASVRSLPERDGYRSPGAAVAFLDMDITRHVHDEVARVLAPLPRVVVAVSGGLDSMTLLHAVAHAKPDRIAAVAVFDHRTGPAARRAVAHVREAVETLRLPLRVGRATRTLRPTEAAWRDARWGFLRAVAHELDAVVITGHSRDDHLETVFMRAMRDAGARGLAALHAGRDVARPLLAFTRADLAQYAAKHALRWVDDPSNESLVHARNRARHELLPALERAQPGLSQALLALSHNAWSLRRELDDFIDAAVPHTICVGRGSNLAASAGSLEVARPSLASYDADHLRLLWPALASRVGLTLDRRGTERLATFTIMGRPGARVQVSGGFEAVRVGDSLVLRRSSGEAAPNGERTLTSSLSMGEWHFRRMTGAGDSLLPDLWWALLPAQAKRVRVRGWRDGDRMVPHGTSNERRLKGLFRDAGVDAGRRRAWPIVLVDGRIVWVPGVRRSSAATVRSGRPMALYRCERDDC